MPLRHSNLSTSTITESQQIAFLGTKIFFMVLGLIFFLVGRSIYKKIKYLTDHGVTTMGTVIDLKKEYFHSTRSGNSVSYNPVVEFKTGTNKLIRFESEVGANPPDFEIHQQVEIIYLPENPQNASIKDGKSLYLMPYGFMAGGVFAFLVGFGLLFVSLH